MMETSETMKYETDGERQIVDDTQRRTGERAGRQTDNWRQINWERDKMGDTWGGTYDERQVKAQKRHPESRTPLQTVRETNEGRHVKRHIQIAEHHQPETEPNDGKQDKTSKERHLESRTPPGTLGEK